MLLSSVDSIAINDILQHPVDIFYYDHEINLSNHKIEYLDTSLPADIIVANIKNIINIESGSFNGTGLTIHRRAVSCDFPSHDVSYCSDDSRILVGRLFKDILAKTVQNTSLTYLYEHNLLVRDSSIELVPMEMQSFRLTWN